MWEASAEYADGTSVCRLFEYREDKAEYEQQYELECWLIGRHAGCTWYSVVYVDIVEEDIMEEDIVEE